MPRTSGAVALWIGIACSGCVSLHEMRPTEIDVLDSATNRAVASLAVKVSYPYDSYGVLHIFRQPDPVQGATDHDGRFIADIATWSHRILLELGEKSFVYITADNVRTGGSFKSSPKGNSGVTYSVIVKPRAK